MHPNSTLRASSQRGPRTARQGSRVLQERNRRSAVAAEGRLSAVLLLTSPRQDTDTGAQESLNLGPRGAPDRWSIWPPHGRGTGRGAEDGRRAAGTGPSLRSGEDGHRGGPHHPPHLLPWARPVLRPQRPGSPGQQRQSLGRWRLSPAGPMVGRGRNPTVPGSGVLPQRREEGGRSRLGRAEAGGTAQSERRRVEKEPAPAGKGKAAGTRWRCRAGARLTRGASRSLGSSRLVSMHAAPAAPPTAPHAAPCGGGDAPRWLRAALASLSPEGPTLTAASWGGR